MRLLNTHTYEFKEFLGEERPSYVILSHRWSDDEVSYKEFRKGAKKQGVGYEKIVNACRVAREVAKLDWIWIDSCCIDKRSSAELSEAINSMWNWYAWAEICYIHLADVSSAPENREQTMEQFRRSDWFNRGWTLQELLAPEKCIFWSGEWRTINTKLELSDEIVSITGIERRCLDSPFEAQRACAAKIMHWASRRRTTRPEDIAYCLMGVFRINMPLLYGEGGEKAFVRLQLAILDKGGDQSLFAWGCPSWADGEYTSLLAPDPAFFIYKIESLDGPAVVESHWVQHCTISLEGLFYRSSYSIDADVLLYWLPFLDEKKRQICLALEKDRFWLGENNIFRVVRRKARDHGESYSQMIGSEFPREKFWRVTYERRLKIVQDGRTKKRSQDHLLQEPVEHSLGHYPLSDLARREGEGEVAMSLQIEECLRPQYVWTRFLPDPYDKATKEAAAARQASHSHLQPDT